MLRLFVLLLVLTLCFHVLQTTYIINSDHAEFQKIYALIARIERQLPPRSQPDTSLSRDIVQQSEALRRSDLGQPEHVPDWMIKAMGGTP
jgi:hypothetical protein